MPRNVYELPLFSVSIAMRVIGRASSSAGGSVGHGALYAEERMSEETALMGDYSNSPATLDVIPCTGS